MFKLGVFLFPQPPNGKALVITAAVLLFAGIALFLTP